MAPTSKKESQFERAQRIIIDLLKSNFFDVTTDVVVVLNAAYVYLEVDMPEMVEGYDILIPTVFCVYYIAECSVRLLWEGSSLFLKRPLHAVEFFITMVAIAGVFASSASKVVWRLSVFRLVRCLRIMKKAGRSYSLADLWLVLVGLKHSARAMMWLLLLLALAALIFGGATRGLVYAGTDDDLTTVVCGGDNFRIHLRCLDVDRYFGSVSDTALTMMQITTLDRWAAHVVRPLAGMRPEAAFFCVLFVIGVSYGLLSIVIGAVVWCTVSLARQHDNHRDRVTLVQGVERIKDLRNYFHRCLKLEDRELLDFREIREGMQIPQVKKAYNDLDLPVTDIHQLWEHLDERAEGEITLDQFEHGCKILLEPAKRFDMACLSARLHGRAAFAENLERRCESTIADMDDLFARLSVGMGKLRKHVLSEDVNELFAEVGLRRAGRMHIPHPIEDQ
jgi:hypothetical protein